MAFLWKLHGVSITKDFIVDRQLTKSMQNLQGDVSVRASELTEAVKSSL